MPFSPVSTVDVNAQIIASIEFQISQTIPLLPKAFARVLARALAGVITLLYKYNNFMLLQMFVSTASFASITVNGLALTPLEEWGKLLGVGLPVPATAAELDLTVAVGTISATPIPAGTQFVGLDNQVTYLSTATVVPNASTITIPVIAAGDQTNGGGAGTIGNLDAGAVVSFVTTPAGVQQDATVGAVLVTAADNEGETAYRDRVLARFQSTPQGGALVDYKLWGEATAGIIRVYPYTGKPGQVDVYSEATVASSGSADGIPTPAQLTAVADAIALDVDARATLQPVNALVNSLPITRRGFNVIVSGLVVDDPTTVQASISSALDTLLRSKEPYIGGVSTLRRDRVTQADLAGTVSNVVQAAGGVFAGLILQTVPTTSAAFIGQVVTAGDDAVEVATVVTLGGASLALGGPARTTAFRVTGVTVPAGATITSASLELRADALDNTFSDFAIRGEAVANAAAYTAAASNITSRNYTVASVPWVPSGWASGTDNTSPDIAAVVQEIVDVSGWAMGNAMALTMTGTDDSARSVAAYEAGAPTAAKLTITYDIVSGAPLTTSVYTLTRGEKAKLDGLVFA